MNTAVDLQGLCRSSAALPDAATRTDREPELPHGEADQDGAG